MDALAGLTPHQQIAVLRVAIAKLQADRRAMSTQSAQVAQRKVIAQQNREWLAATVRDRVITEVAKTIAQSQWQAAQQQQLYRRYFAG